VCRPVVARVLRVGAALPDPPFEVPGPDGTAGYGLDIDLTRAISRHLGWGWELHRYTGDDFDGIFTGLGDGRWDVVASGATVTGHRETLARFCAPYLRSGQSLVVRADRRGTVHTVDDLHDETVGVQHGNTSEPVVRQLVAERRVAGIEVYPYDRIVQALDDVEHGTIGGFMKLEPVMRVLTAHRPGLAIAQTGITDERIALSVRTGDDDLAARIDDAQRALVADGTFAELGRRWLPDSDPHATAMLT
jgi:polar amino acid transport system substrate-binding protein